MPKSVSTRSAYKMLTCIYLCRTLLFFAPYADFFAKKMKTKIQVLAMMFIAAMAFSACDDDDKNDNIKVPDAVSKALKDKYPAAMDIEWERKGDYFVADCWMDGREMDVWYDVQATWKLTETDILWEGLPPTVQTAFEGGEYAQWKREDIDMLEYPVQPVQYVIEVERGNEEYQLFYAGDGNLLQKRDVSGNKDDTHWPIDELKTGR